MNRIVHCGKTPIFVNNEKDVLTLLKNDERVQNVCVVINGDLLLLKSSASRNYKILAGLCNQARKRDIDIMVILFGNKKLDTEIKKLLAWDKTLAK